MIVVVRGSITRREQRTAATGPEIVLLLEQSRGPSIPVVWRGPTNFSVGDVVEASGDQDSEGYVNAASIQKVSVSGPTPQPQPEKPRLYVFRAFMGSFLGDLLALILVNTQFKKSGLAQDMIFAILASVFAAGLTALFARSNRKVNAMLGGGMAVVIPLFIYLLIKALSK